MTIPAITIENAPEKTVKADRAPRPAAAKASATKSSTAPATASEINKALATLESGYNLIATGLFIAGLTETAEEWIASAEQLNLSNKDALSASPKLAKAIANAGNTGGSATFFVTHGMAFFSLAKVATRELETRRLERLAATQTERGDVS